MICRAWASPHQQSDVRKLSSDVPEEADLPCFCYIELFWFCPSRHCWNQHTELSWLNWQKPVNMYLYSFKGWWCSCRQSIAIVIFRCDWNFVPFHFFSALLSSTENLYCSFAYGQERLYSQATLHPLSNRRVQFVLWTQHDFLLLFFKVTGLLLLWTDSGMTFLGKAQDVYWQMLPVP